MVRVKDVMTPVGGYVQPEMTLRDAAKKMTALRIDPMPVVQNDRVVGVITARALSARAARDGLAVGSELVSEVMSTAFTCCRAEQTVSDALRMFDRGDTERTLVVDETGRLVGLVSLDDLHKQERRSSGEVNSGSVIEPASDGVNFDDDRVDFMSDASFPASDPVPPPTILGRTTQCEE
jgi:CBS domain-containing protein